MRLQYKPQTNLRHNSLLTRETVVPGLVDSERRRSVDNDRPVVVSFDP
jgi:hypothetical protein